MDRGSINNGVDVMVGVAATISAAEELVEEIGTIDGVGFAIELEEQPINKIERNNNRNIELLTACNHVEGTRGAAENTGNLNFADLIGDTLK